MAIGLISFPQEADPPRVRDSIIRVLVFFLFHLQRARVNRLGKVFFFCFLYIKNKQKGISNKTL